MIDTTSQGRARVQVSETVPVSGLGKASTNLIVIWDDSASFGDIEASIAGAAARALQLAKERHVEPFREQKCW